MIVVAGAAEAVEVEDAEEIEGCVYGFLYMLPDSESSSDEKSSSSSSSL